MAEPVKTQVLKAVETMLGEIPEIKTVYRWQDIPTDLDELENGTPALFFWEEEEKEPWNRLTLGKLDFWMAVFIKLEGEINNIESAAYQTFSELADLIAGKIHGKFAAPASLRAVGLIQAEEGMVRKALANELYGELVVTYQLTYGHARGDAFTMNVS